MSEVFVLSDTHFYHSNILTFKDNEGSYFRGSLFADVEEMNETIIDNWNSVVSDSDIIYHLGDVYFGSRPKMPEIFSRLRGRKRLILGNHDNAKHMAQDGFFQKISMWRMFPEFGLLLTHVPVHESSLEMKDLVNVHGHIHQNASPAGPYVNVSCEAINYTPVNIEELRTR